MHIPAFLTPSIPPSLPPPLHPSLAPSLPSFPPQSPPSPPSPWVLKLSVGGTARRQNFELQGMRATMLHTLRSPTQQRDLPVDFANPGRRPSAHRPSSTLPSLHPSLAPSFPPWVFKLSVGGTSTFLKLRLRCSVWRGRAV